MSGAQSYWTSTCKTCALKAQRTTGRQRHISRSEHEAVLEKVRHRLDHNPNAMGVRRQTVEHPFGTTKDWMGATHFLTRKLPKVAAEIRHGAKTRRLLPTVPSELVDERLCLPVNGSKRRGLHHPPEAMPAILTTPGRVQQSATSCKAAHYNFQSAHTGLRRER